jgi:site-specific recombinase XerC
MNPLLAPQVTLLVWTDIWPSRARKDAGLPKDLVLYCARHGFGTEVYRATKNLFAVVNVMGHTAVSTTMKYQHQNIDEVASVASHRLQ